MIFRASAVPEEVLKQTQPTIMDSLPVLRAALATCTVGTADSSVEIGSASTVFTREQTHHLGCHMPERAERVERGSDLCCTGAIWQTDLSSQATVVRNSGWCTRWLNSLEDDVRGGEFDDGK
jgi:hypothetical protein